MEKSIKTCLSPALVPFYDISESVVVIIDIFRATSTICYAIEQGVKNIIPVATIEECFSHKANGYLLAGERNGAKIEGFDLGNSPITYTSELIQNKTIVLTTTNGTQAIEVSKNSKAIVIGSFLNIDALSEWLIKQPHDILLLCSGYKNTFCIEDTLFAGAVVNKVKSHFNPILCDSSMAAEDLFLYAQPNIYQYVSKSSHNKRLQELDIDDDIQLCLTNNIVGNVPILSHSGIVKA